MRPQRIDFQFSVHKLNFITASLRLNTISPCGCEISFAFKTMKNEDFTSTHRESVGNELCVSLCIDGLMRSL